MSNASQPESSGFVVNSILSTTTAVLSIFGTVFIIISYFAWRDIRTTSRRILCYISIGDFFTAIGTILGNWSHDNTVCLMQTIVGTTAVLSSFFWTIFMALYLYIGITKRLPLLADRLLIVFHVIGWGVPVIIVSVAAGTGKLGNNGDLVSSGWCWIRVDLPWKEQIKWMLVAGMFWEITASVIITCLYILVKRSMKHELRHRDDNRLSQHAVCVAQKAEKKLILVPLAFVLIRIWGIIRFFIVVGDGPAHDTSQYMWLMILQGIGDSAQGFTNFCIFCFFTDKVQSQIRDCYRSCCRRLCLPLKSGRERQPTLTTPDEDVTYGQSTDTNYALDNPAVTTDCVTVQVSHNTKASVNVG